MNRLKLVVLAVLWTGTACGGCGSPGPLLVNCPTVELDRTTAQPLEGVRMRIEPAEKFTDLSGLYRSDSEELSILLDTHPSGTPVFLVPLHPDGIAGGAGTLEFTYKDKQCETVDFAIEPLAPSEGASNALLDELRGLLDASIGAYSLPADTDLVASVERIDDEVVIDLPPRAFHLGLLQYLVDHPDNESSVIGLIEAMDHDARRDFDAVLGKLDVVEWVAFEREALLAQSIPWIDADAPVNAASGLFEKPDIRTCSQLLDLVWSGRRACNVVRSGWSSMTTQVDAVDGLGVLGVEGLAKKAGYSAAKAGKASIVVKGFAAGALGTAAALGAWSTFRCATLPESATGFRVGDTALTIVEDRPELTGFSEIRINAKTGDATSLAGRMMDLVAAGLTIAGTKDLPDTLVKSVEGEMKGLANVAVSAAFDAAGVDMVGGWSWSDIDVDDPRCTGLVVREGHAVKDGLCRTAMCLRHEELGTSTVAVYKRVASRPPFAFGSINALPGPIEGEEVSVDVVPIRVELEPRVQLVEPGEPVTIPYRVIDVTDPVVEWSYRGNAFATNDRAGLVTLETPRSELEYPLQVDAVAESELGLREPSRRQGVRVGRSILAVGDIMVFPQFTCLPPGSQLQMEAFVRRGHVGDIAWNPTGLVSDDGLFTAPHVRDHTFPVVVSAQYPDGSEVSDEAEIRVSTDCSCSHSLLTFGALQTAYRHKWEIRVQRVPGSDMLILEFLRDGINSVDVIIETKGEIKTGPYRGEILVHRQEGLPFGALDDRLVTLLRIDDRHIAGRITTTLEGPDDQRAFADFQFHFVDDAGLIMASETCMSREDYDKSRPRKIVDLVRGK